jgi:hypothetical protein
MNRNHTLPTLPWWRAPAGWLMVGLPATAVMASIALFVLAWRDGDAVVLKTALPRADTMSPAQQARNHAATPR